MIQRTFMFTTDSDKNKNIQLFRNTLSKQQKIIYEKIIQERRTIYYQGFLAGLGITLLYLVFMSSYYKTNIMMWKNACIAVVISGFTTYFYYMLSPKSDYMILHLTDNKQREEWFEVYKFMQYNYHLSFIYGLGGVLFLSLLY